MPSEVSNDICGCELGADVRNGHGQILLTSGTVLNEKHLRTLRMWGIRRVVLASERVNSNSRGPISRELLERCAVQERRRFACCDLGHPALHQCYLLAVRRRAEGKAADDDGVQS